MGQDHFHSREVLIILFENFQSLGTGGLKENTSVACPPSFVNFDSKASAFQAGPKSNHKIVFPDLF